MAEIYGGHLVAKYLKEVEDVDTVFSLSGGHIDRIYDGFLEYGRPVDRRAARTGRSHDGSCLVDLYRAGGSLPGYGRSRIHQRFDRRGQCLSGKRTHGGAVRHSSV